MLINRDCKFYSGNKPCKYHKQDGRVCEGCLDYRKIKERILIIKLDALGDVLRTTIILPALKKKFPDSHITWITKANAAALLRNNGHIDRVLNFENNYLGYILNEEFDIGICLDADNAGATILSIADCKQKSGFQTDKKGLLYPSGKESEDLYLMGLNDNLKKRNRKTYQQIIYEISGLSGEIFSPQLFPDDKTVNYSKAFAEKHRIGKDDFVIGLNTGGGSRWECKKWIREYYPELISGLQNYDKKMKIILFGGESEKNIISYVLGETVGEVYDAECYGSISEFAGIISLTDIFITPDSLGFHMSVALGKYTIVLVGPTSPWELDVYGNGEIVYNDALDCIACYDTLCRRNKECMTTLTPNLIYKKVIKRIEEVSNS
ncbi:MAG: glycosyltransferase family 9 protein [Ignavibacteriae bacterium]|nr:glycosyltransferase family 9 protein [Ignavibacteriota bacterium]